MKNITKKLLSVLLVLTTLTCILVVGASAEESGNCGANLTWTFNAATGELVISGTGEMNDWKTDTDVPWYSKRFKILSATIEEGVTSIGYNAFWCCGSLTSIEIPDSVTSIGDFAFYSCVSLTSIEIPDSVISIGYEAFCSCNRLTSVTIGDSVTSIDDYAFAYCYNLASIEIPNSVTRIGIGAFFRTEYYDTPDNWDNGMLYVGKYLINAENTISGSYYIKDGTQCIADRVLYDCDSLISIEIPDSVTSIGKGVLSNCDSLTSIEIPDSVTSIGDYAFMYCVSLTSITVDYANTAYSSDEYGVLFNKNKTELRQYPAGNTRESYKIPDSVTSIGDRAFWCCDSLTSIEIPDSVTSIGDYVFENCDSLTSIEISDSVTNIGNGAFYRCASLTDVFYTGSVTEWMAIDISPYENESLLNATIHCNYENNNSGSTDIPDNTPDCESSVVDVILVATPSQTEISYGDSIILHVDLAKIPEGGYVEWSADNANFSYEVSEDGTTCTITPNKSGDTTFTVKVFDAEGNEISSDTQKMTSKAGFFDKIIAFFKKLFGLTKIITQSIYANK